MNNIIISPSPAEELNRYVMDKISKHLFLLCNYNPESITVYSYDARFSNAVMNLYKLLIDCGICNRLNWLYKKYSLSYNSEKLEQLLSIVNSFRNFIGHNQDSRNGTLEDEKNVEKWFSNQIGKKYPENLEEYIKPLEELYRYGEESVNILKSFIEEVAKHRHKQDIITDWEKLIFEYYKRPNSKNIFRGHMEMAYKAQKGNTSGVKKIDIASWIQKMYLYKEQSQNDSFNEIIKKHKLSPKVIKEIEQKIEENNKRLDEKMTKIAYYKNKNKNTLTVYDYYDYYIDSFPKRIMEEHGNGSVTSLLPQDVVQQIIENDFSLIPV